MLNDRLLIQEWFNHLFPIINILVNVRFTLAHSLTRSLSRCVAVCTCLHTAMSQSTRRESGSNVYHFTAYTRQTHTADHAKRTRHTEDAAVAATATRKKSECKGKGNENEQEKCAIIQQRIRKENKRVAVALRARTHTLTYSVLFFAICMHIRDPFLHAHGRCFWINFH